MERNNWFWSLPDCCLWGLMPKIFRCIILYALHKFIFVWLRDSYEPVSRAPGSVRFLLLENICKKQKIQGWSNRAWWDHREEPLHRPLHVTSSWIDCFYVCGVWWTLQLHIYWFAWRFGGILALQQWPCTVLGDHGWWVCLSPSTSDLWGWSWCEGKGLFWTILDSSRSIGQL